MAHSRIPQNLAHSAAESIAACIFIERKYMQDTLFTKSVSTLVAFKQADKQKISVNIELIIRKKW